MATVRDDAVIMIAAGSEKGQDTREKRLEKQIGGGSGLVNQFRFCFFCFFGLERPLGTLT